MPYNKLNGAIEIYEEMLPSLKTLRKNLEAWYKKQGDFAITREEGEDITLLVYDYITAKERKKTKRWVRDKVGKTYNERVDKVLPIVGKLGLELIKMPTKKGRLLMDMLTDLAHNPEDYIYKPTEAKATRDDINAYLKKLGIRKELKKELYDIIENHLP